jgi:hypothetical protein
MGGFPSLGRLLARRAFLWHSSAIVGGLALAALFRRDGKEPGGNGKGPGENGKANCKRIIYLFQSGGPSHLDLFDPKPELNRLAGTSIPPSILGDARVPFQSQQKCSLPLVPSGYTFKPAGKCGMELSSLVPATASIADRITLLRAVYTDHSEHMPAATLYFTGSERPGRPSIGSWLAYGLGSANKHLPEFVVLLSGSGGQPLHSNFWGSGFMPTRYAGVEFRSVGDPVLYVGNPPGIDRPSRRRLIDCARQFNELHYGRFGDPEIQTRIHAYEQTFLMQTSVPDLMDLSNEPESVLKQYGAEPGKPSYGNNCLLARRLIERGVRFVQLCHRDWDHHKRLPGGITAACQETDQASAALVANLQRLGLLEDTLVVWGGEFGRTPYSQGPSDPKLFGRDHHPGCFSVWMAGCGAKEGFVYGKSDDFGFNIAEGGVHINDLHATILHLMGVDHTRLTYRSQGRDFRLTDVAGNVIKDILA